MPILKNAKTVWVGDEPWKSPDGKVTIWTIKLEVDGERNTHNTMSKAIATEGWTGDVDLYTKPNGKEYVRQAPKEETSFGGNTQPAKYAPKSEEQQESIARSVALKAAVDAASHTKLETTNEGILHTADVFLAWLQGGYQESAAVPTPSADSLGSRKRDERDEFNDFRQRQNEPWPDTPPEDI